MTTPPLTSSHHYLTTTSPLPDHYLTTTSPLPHHCKPIAPSVLLSTVRAYRYVCVGIVGPARARSCSVVFFLLSCSVVSFWCLILLSRSGVSSCYLVLVPVSRYLVLLSRSVISFSFVLSRPGRSFSSLLVVLHCLSINLGATSTRPPHWRPRPPPPPRHGPKAFWATPSCPSGQSPRCQTAGSTG